MHSDPDELIHAWQAIEAILSSRRDEPVTYPDDIRAALDWCTSMFLDDPDLWRAFEDFMVSNLDGALEFIRIAPH